MAFLRRRPPRTGTLGGKTALGAAVAMATATAVAMPGTGHATAGDTGFDKPYAGAPRYERFAPREATTGRQINRALGRKRADHIARKIGLDSRRVFTERQFRLFVSGRGVGGDPDAAELVDQSVRILTNTRGRPLWADVAGRWTPTVLSSYGLMVNREGLLQSPANEAAPTRQVNTVIEPGGYLPRWCRRNGARDSLRMLYRSAYLKEAVYGNDSQESAGVAQLVPNTRHGRTTTVGMSMAPSIWIVNFALIYVLKPGLAAKMPGRWTAIPEDVVQAIEASPDGQVPYADYAGAFRR